MMLTESLAIIEYWRKNRAQIRSLLYKQPTPSHCKTYEYWSTFHLRQPNAKSGQLIGSPKHLLSGDYLAKVSGKYAYKDAVSLIDVCIPPRCIVLADSGKSDTISNIGQNRQMLTELPEFKMQMPIVSLTHQKLSENNDQDPQNQLL
uniref:Uncharacterized protein n=1 Tax=Ditylenchus dipsaci TaxID=166011 RepID=A0A915D8F3_9BILA